MTSVTINRLTNGNCYLNGQSLFGRVENVDLPTVKAKMEDHTGLGMIGDIEFPSGIEKMDCKVKWNAVYPYEAGVASDFFTAVQFMFMGNLEVYDAAGGKIDDQPVVAYVRGTFKQGPPLSFKPRTNVDSQSEMNVTAYSLFVNSNEIFAVDVIAQIYRVNGVDMYQQYRQNIGI